MNTETTTTTESLKVECANCDWHGDVDQADETRDFWSRVEPGDTVPAGDCPECGAFVFPAQPEPQPAPYAQRVRETAERIVREDVLLCLSSLIYEATQGESARMGERDSLIDEDDALNLWRVKPDADDYEEANRYEDDGLTIQVAQSDDDSGWYSWQALDADGDTEHEGEAESALEAWQEAFRAADRDEPDGGEVYEHWAVTGYLASRLQERGHSVTDIFGMKVWGRPTTGQMIVMDAVILDIAREIVGPEPEAVEGEGS